MTRGEIITKAEEQLQYTLEQATTHKSEIWARNGLAQLTMLDYILDEEYKDYSKWFEKFIAYIN